MPVRSPGAASARIVVRGAREHNLKNLDVDIPRDRLTVITGLSGSGKSSLAFDTIYAEGQRRFVESLSAYARQFLEVMERPEVDLIEGLSPAISIEQKTVSRNPRSTVGTVTEIYDYLRLLFARAGVQHCTRCGRPVEKQTTDQIIARILSLPAGTNATLLAPVVRGRKGHYRELFEEILRDGFVRVRVDGVIREITPGMQVDRYKVHDVEIVVDRIVTGPAVRSRVAESVEVALRFGGGVLIVRTDEDILLSRHLSCPVCNLSYEEPAPNSFSFNSPQGSCPACNGLGETRELSLDLIIPDDSLSIAEGGLAPLGKPRSTWLFSQIRAVGKKYRFDFDTPLRRLSARAREALLNGAGDERFEIEYRFASGRKAVYRHRFHGVLEALRHQYAGSASPKIREWAEAYMNAAPCAACRGGRLRPESLAVRLPDERGSRSYSIHDIVRLTVREASELFAALGLSGRRETIAAPVLKEIRARLAFLAEVGLEYLTLERSARSLSGGEGQRIRLATQIGSQLVGVLYILDEPSIGLHQRDNRRLIGALKRLRDLGNTVLVVEHDREMIESADHVVDLGPGAGEHGGRLVLAGSPALLRRRGKASASSATAAYLSGVRRIPLPEVRRSGHGKVLVLEGAKGNNLREVALRLPLGTFIAVTGVSGSGKSSLITETLVPILAQKLHRARTAPLPYRSVKGIEGVDKVIEIDQSPIGRTPRSNPATYTGIFTHIRDLFTHLPEARIRGYRAGRFSFNVEGGRCDSCEGDGVRKIEMNFLPDVYVLCDVCRGRRYNRETLQVVYRGKSIADVLDMTVEESAAFFEEIPPLRRKLQTLHDVGLGYIRLGQQATTLSGGEAQRVKLAAELSRIGTGKTLYILDEPTTGLHFEDIRVLLEVLGKLVEKGNTVVVIEHNLDVVKTADWVVDLGPGGGADGGRIVAEGTPEQVAKARGSVTGEYLRAELRVED